MSSSRPTCPHTARTADPTKACGWLVCLSGLYAPIVFDALTGMVAYHPRDNAFVPYSRIMRFILRVYEVHAALRRGRSVQGVRRQDARNSRLVAVEEVA